MIYLFTGDDSKKKIESYEKFIKSLPSALEVFYINRNNLNREQVESFFYGQGLFSPKSVIVFTGLLEREENLSFILSKLTKMKDSVNDFVFLEDKLNKIISDSFKKVDTVLNIFELPKEKKEKFNNFLLTYAFEKKDKLNLWIYFRQAVELGVALDELTGVLFWKVKDMILKKDFSKFNEEKLQEILTKISCLLPEARISGMDAEIAFEKFLLEVI